METRKLELLQIIHECNIALQLAEAELEALENDTAETERETP